MSDLDSDRPRVPPTDRFRALPNGRAHPRPLALYASLEYPWEAGGWLFHRLATRAPAPNERRERRGSRTERRRRSRSR